MGDQWPRIVLAVLLVSIPQALWAQSTIRIGEVKQGSLTKSDKQLDQDGSFYDWYVLEAKCGQRIKLDLKSDSFDPYLVLLDRDGTEIASSSGIRAERPARIEITLSYSGKYHIRVNSLHQDGLGQYLLGIK